MQLRFPLPPGSSKIQIAGREYVIIPLAQAGGLIFESSGTPESVPDPIEHSLVPEGAAASPRRKRVADATHDPNKRNASNGAPPETAKFGPVAGKLIQILERSPRTSAELIELTKFTPSSIYSTLHTLKKKGSVETRPGEDGQRRHFVVAQSLAAQRLAAQRAGQGAS